MDSNGNRRNLYHVPNLNRSREEQQTYMNPMYNVPSYTRDGFDYAPNPHYIYHPIVMPQTQQYPQMFSRPHPPMFDFNQRVVRSQPYPPKNYNQRRSNNNYHRHPDHRHNQHPKHYHQNNHYYYQNPNYQRSNSYRYDRHQESTATTSEIRNCAKATVTSDVVTETDPSSDCSMNQNSTIDSSFDRSACNGTLETSNFESSTSFDCSSINQSLDIKNSTMERSCTEINQSIELPPVYATMVVPILGSPKPNASPFVLPVTVLNDSSIIENQNESMNATTEGLTTIDDANKTENTTVDESCENLGNVSSEKADDSGIRPENESSELEDSEVSEIKPEQESSGIVDDVVPSTSENATQAEIVYQLDNSSNAVDHNISQSVPNDCNADLSFNGKIASLTKETQPVEESEEEKLRNESFEILKKEDSSMMVYLNEKSPDLFDTSDLNYNDEDPSDSEVTKETEEAEESEQTEDDANKLSNTSLNEKLNDCDKKILSKLKNSLSSICPPPSVTRITKLTTEQLLSMYKENVDKPGDPVSDFRAEMRGSFFKPTHTPNEILTMDWKDKLLVKCLDVYYNRNNYCEVTEKLLLKYSDRFVNSETISSMTITKSPSSSKKQTAKYKLLSQSPGTRLSHLAKRRSIFSSANLRSNSLNSSQASVKTTLTATRQVLVDKRKLPLLQKSSRASPRRKTPGKRKKTPKSKKKENQLLKSASKSSKRALFTSPMYKFSSTSDLSKVQRSKRALFSPIDAKRKRTDSMESDDSLVCGNLLKPTKVARIDNSPNKMMKSYSFSVCGNNGGESSASLLRKSLVRTQSEILNGSTQSQPGQSNSYKQPLTDEHKRKLLWAASSALSSKQISKDHEKFKEYATLLVKLTKKMFLEFYDPGVKSMSTQMFKFANFMVFYVIQGKSFDEISNLAKEKFQKTKNASRLMSYKSDFEINRNLVRRSSSSLFQSTMSSSTSSLNLNFQSSVENLSDVSVAHRKMSMSENSSSNSKTDGLSRSSSKNNDAVGALRENYLRDDSGKKATTQQQQQQRTSGNDVSKLFVGKPSSNLLKAKRQISF